MNDNDKVVELEDGGFLYGEATVTDENDPTFEPVEYNSFDDPNSITVKDAKKIIQEGSASNFARGSNVPDSSTKTLTLKPNSHYQSSEFSGTGWRFGEVDDVVFNKKSLTRTYKPLVSQTQYISAFISDSNRFKLLCGLVDEEDDLDSLNELQKLIDKRKKEIR